MICKICGKEYLKARDLSNHLKFDEYIKIKDYYDAYLKEEKEGICLTCGKFTKFINVNKGYAIYCCIDCRAKSPIKYSYNNSQKNQNTVTQRNIQFEKEHNCTQIGKLIHQYGQGWLSLNLPKIMRNKNAHFISNDYLPMIINYASKNHSYRSNKEIDLYDFVCSIYDGEVSHNTRKVVKHYELDIWIPNLSLAIEFNGIKWHCEENNMNNNYHLKKSLACRQQNIRLIHIYEFENFGQQKQLLKDLILGQDNYPKDDFNKNNLIKNIPKPEIVYRSKQYTLYGAGPLY